MIGRTDIIRSIGEAALYEQLAEEAAELAQAALKMARILRDENPTPVSIEEAQMNLKEEYTDVILTSDMLGMRSPMRELYISKAERWAKRIIEKREQEEAR